MEVAVGRMNKGLKEKFEPVLFYSCAHLDRGCFKCSSVCLHAHYLQGYSQLSPVDWFPKFHLYQSRSSPGQHWFFSSVFMTRFLFSFLKAPMCMTKTHEKGVKKRLHRMQNSSIQSQTKTETSTKFLFRLKNAISATEHFDYFIKFRHSRVAGKSCAPSVWHFTVLSICM